MTDTLWGSDAVAAIVQKLNLRYAALVPGASYRGLHDSIVNFSGNENPRMLLCLHEEAAVAIAHGYAKVTGEPMLAIVHSNVGLLHATMAIFDAYCDRVPVIVFGANGPVDATKRRPWIDWIHTTLDMGAPVRDFTKWDDAPGSPGAAVESVLRAWQIATTAPHGPTFVVFDAAWQEQRLDQLPPIPDDPSKFAAPAPPAPSSTEVARVAELLRRAKRPALIAGRSSRSLASWNARVALAEVLDATVVSVARAGAVFPSEHRLHVGHTGQKAALEALRAADVILDLDAIDVGGILRDAFGGEVTATVISCSLDRFIHKAWVADYQLLPALDVNIAASPELLVDELVKALGAAVPAPVHHNGAAPRTRPAPEGGRFTMEAFSATVGEAFAGTERCFIKLARGVKASDVPQRHPLDALGADGGGGVGSGPGLAVGAALALKGTSRLPVAILGDGDYLMGVTALWTAVANEIPLLVVVANNRSFYNDEVHQERIAIRRGRPPERKWIGMRIDGPAPDCAKFAEAQGAIGIGPVTDADALAVAIAQGIAHVRAGKVCVIDAHVVPDAVAAAAVSADVVVHDRAR
jgi:thiamine pyrophosphate-dependent acetolactate synthase large subunit-like protein